MQVTEGDVIDSGENGGGGIPDAADAQIALGFAHDRRVGAPGDEGVSRDEGAHVAALSEVSPHAVHGSVEHGGVRALSPELLAMKVRLEVGHAVRRDGYAIGAFDDEGVADVLE